VKSVKDFKQHRHTLYKWSQVVEISNKLMLVASLIFLFISIIQAVINSPPLLASLSAQSYTNNRMNQNQYNKYLYTLQIINAALILIIAIIGTVLRTKLLLSIADTLAKLLSMMPVILTILLVIEGFLSYLYLKKTFVNQTYITDKIKLQTWITLGVTTLITIVMQVGGCIIVKKVQNSFKVSLEDYVDFLLLFEETPRSKFAKKYIPPLDVLAEETTSQYTTTVRGSVVNN